MTLVDGKQHDFRRVDRARLRKKLPPGLIETVRGLGYRLTSPQ